MKINSIRYNFKWTTSSFLITTIVTMLLFPFLVINLGENKYGFLIFLTTINGLSVIADFGLGDSSIKFISESYLKQDFNKIYKIISNGTILYFLIALTMLSLIYIFKSNIILLIKDLKYDFLQAQNLLVLNFIAFAIRLSFSAFSSIPKAIQRYDLSSKIVVIESILRVLSYVLTIKLGYGLSGIIYSEIFLSIFSSSCYFIISLKIFKNLKLSFIPDQIVIKEISGYSFYIFISQLLGVFWQYTDRILLVYFVGTTALTFFSIPQQIVFKVLGLIAVGFSVLFPKFSSLNSNHSQIKLLFQKFTYLSLSVSIILFSSMSFVISDFLSIYISSDFSQNAGQISIILALSCIARGAFIVYENLFKGIGKPKYNTVITFFSVLIIVIIDILLIPKMGINGAAYAYLFSPIIGIFTLFFIWKKVLKNNSYKTLIINIIIPLFLTYIFVFAGIGLKQKLELAVSWLNIILTFLFSSAFISLLLCFYYRYFSTDVYENYIKPLMIKSKR